ncbi:cytochrome P450 [Mycena pura]|uniref:Cytochrome P450 n=1 Tax=Mycena pura TaxID=153505 RepID=A0AAD6YCU0_9AGAR|nr:cytochrome P450 [Mycena pura]
MSTFSESVRSLTDTLANLNPPWALPGTLVLGGIGICYVVLRQSGLPLPPGPSISWLDLSGKGNVKMPQAYAWLVFADWQKKFGDVIYVNVFRNPLLVVNSAEAAVDLLDKKSNIYSSRPIRTMQVEVMGFSWLFSGLPYGPWYKKHRTMFHNHFQAKVIPKYHNTLVDSAHTLLRNLSRTPENLLHHLRRATSFRHHVAEQGDDYVRLADQAMAGVSLSANFGTFLVDYIPLLKYVPAWFPGAKFKRDGLRWRKLGLEMWNRPFDMVKNRLAEGSAEPCLATAELEDLFQQANPDPEIELLIKDVSATAYAAGSDTVGFLIAAGDRLPSFEDRDKLPYLDCLVQECLRWNPVANVALAHYLTEDDVYRGWCLPKGTTVLANIWNMLHDPSRYPDPSAFNPNRFSEAQRVDGLNPLPELAYGFGRRICPGRFLATDTIWIVAVSVIASYKVLKPVDESGKEVTPEVAYTPGLFSRPKPFGCRLVPRSEKIAALVGGSHSA